MLQQAVLHAARESAPAVAVALAVPGSMPAQAQSIPIVNAGFEYPYLVMPGVQKVLIMPGWMFQGNVSSLSGPGVDYLPFTDFVPASNSWEIV